LIHHSDRGGQYAAAEYSILVKAANPEKGIALIESCFGALKTELVW
jgi:transposase InsO family protein